MRRQRASEYYSLGLLVLIMAIGTLGYIFIEGWNIRDSFFMTVITIATVGFSQVHTLSNAGMWFTSFLIIISFGIFAYAITSLSRFVVDGVANNYFRDRIVKQQIEKLSSHVIICGYGRNGMQATKELIDHKIPVVVIEKNIAVANQLRDNTDILVITGDAIHDEILLAANIKTARALITSLPADADNLFVVVSARQLNPHLIINSRVTDENSDRKLRSAGATNIIIPDKLGGRRMARLVSQPDFV